ncbi:MAG: Dyp-type peroxidase [Actinomycetota bacterium]|nr:Dyp-type peroxidase [Actinomycetota bacterium]
MSGPGGSPGATPQPVVAPLTSAAIFLVATVDAGGEAAVRELLAGVHGVARAIGSRAPSGALSVVAAVGSSLFDRCYRGPRPAELHDFAAIEGPRHTAVSTQGDLLFHVRAERMDLCFELASHVAGALRGVGSVVDEVHGFSYFDARDLLGFVDGTENPVGDDRLGAAIVGDEDPEFAGSSYVVVQKYLHDLASWDALPVEEQERAVGRTKLSNIEFPDDAKPSNAHVALNVVEDEDGSELTIVRDNMVFGSAGDAEFGTYFIGYSRSPRVTELMLRRMFLGEPPGNTDRLLDFSRAVTGGLYFVPTIELLEDPPPLP